MSFNSLFMIGTYKIYLVYEMIYCSVKSTMHVACEACEWLKLAE